MHTTDKIINDVAVQLANKIVECTSYKALYEETDDELKRVNELLSKFNNVLDSDQALKDIFDEASQKLEEGK